VSEACTVQEFVTLCNQIKSPTIVAEKLGVSVRSVFKRMSNLEKVGHRFEVSDKRSVRHIPDTNPARLNKGIETGTVLIASDAHYFPGNITRAHKAFVKLCRELKPSVVVMNGDVFDGATVSRWPRIGWDKKPTVRDELKTCQERLGEIMSAAPRASYIWPLGNHDARFETKLAAEASEFEGVQGFQLRDHFPEWKPCWSFFINENTVVKHRFKGGIHATHTNTLWAGRTIVTGHLHSLKVTPFSDYNGDRWGVDSGTLAEPYGEQFVDYCEDSPVNWRSGFVVLTYYKGKLLPPEVCHVMEEGPVFRGQIINV
jgi:predicted phosphodiesterase/biotin operon repressor